MRVIRVLRLRVATKDSVAEHGQKNIGLALPHEVLNKFYYQNAASFLMLEEQ